MPFTIRPFRRDDRRQLTSLVNLHVSTVLPGAALSTNAVLSQLEREPDEIVVDPWVEHRECLVAVRDDALVGAVLLHRFRSDERVRDGYRSSSQPKVLTASWEM